MVSGALCGPPDLTGSDLFFFCTTCLDLLGHYLGRGKSFYKRFEIKIRFCSTVFVTTTLYTIYIHPSQTLNTAHHSTQLAASLLVKIPIHHFSSSCHVKPISINATTTNQSFFQLLFLCVFSNAVTVKKLYITCVQSHC